MKAELHDHNTIHEPIPPEPSAEAPRCLSDVLRRGLYVKLHLLMHYAELARLLAREILDEDLVGLCGERYSRDKPLDGHYRRWGSNPGSIRIGEERVPIEVPRVRDVAADRERPLKSYQKMKQPVEVDQHLEEAILLGLSQRDYGRVASAFLDGFGLSPPHRVYGPGRWTRISASAGWRWGSWRWSRRCGGSIMPSTWWSCARYFSNT